MELIKELKDTLDYLAGHGWQELLMAITGNQLDILDDDIENHLLTPIASIDRGFPGFKEFSSASNLAVFAGAPSKSLLYHAVASPAVRVAPDGTQLSGFPRLRDIEVIENFIYSASNQSLMKLRSLPEKIADEFDCKVAPELAVVMFAYEYRNKASTIHGAHAEMVYSRTGVARAGTADAIYDEQARGFWPASEASAIHTIPCKWAPFISVLVNPSVSTLENLSGFGPYKRVPNDARRQFWLPIHKLFDGPDCLAGENVELSYAVMHENSKIARIHEFFDKMGVKSHVGARDLTSAPYVFRDRIADLSEIDGSLSSFVVPQTHAALVEVATHADETLATFEVPGQTSTPGVGSIRQFFSSLELRGTRGRPVPEYVHIRHVPGQNGKIDSLNDKPSMMATIVAGGYDAIHYLDFTGAGYVQTAKTQLSEELAAVPGFSIVAAPDFYPGVDQSVVDKWFDELSADEPEIWNLIPWDKPNRGSPDPLSGVRDPADPNLLGDDNRPVFAKDQPASDTITCTVCAFDFNREPSEHSDVDSSLRCHTLTDASSGVFAPGWTISRDFTDGSRHIAAYGLGSPFPEDAKLCAALSAFWPAAAPDTTRSYLPHLETSAPMLDSEIGAGKPWDGIEGIRFNGKNEPIEYPDRDFSDYVESAAGNLFDIRETAKVTSDEYLARVYAAARVRNYIRQNSQLFQFDVGDYVLASFDRVSNIPNLHQTILAESNINLSDNAHYFALATKSGNETPVDGDHKRLHSALKDVYRFAVDEENVVSNTHGQWEQIRSGFGS